eukprot:symbB.v1.2.000457.t1/scaffold11.1/size528188/6
MVRSVWNLFWRKDPQPPKRSGRGSVYAEDTYADADDTEGTPNRPASLRKETDEEVVSKKHVPQNIYVRDFLDRHGFSSPSSPRKVGDPNQPCTVSMEKIYALHVAALLGNHDIVSLLLEARADPEQQGAGGKTPIDIAYAENSKGSHSYVLFLLRDAITIKRQEERQFGTSLRRGNTPIDELRKRTSPCSCTGGCNNCEELFTVTY